MEVTKTGCCNAKPVTNGKLRSGAKGSASFLTTLLLIVIPKCPFCVMAYSSSILLFFDIKGSAIMPYVIHFKPILGALVLLLILFNYKGKKTLIAMGIALIALSFLLLSSYAGTFIFPDWVLYCTFLFAAWYNGNFQYFYRFLRFGNQKKLTSN